MLIHVTRFVNVQSQVAELVSLELRDIQNRIRYGDGGSPDPIVEELRSMWLEGFCAKLAGRKGPLPQSDARMPGGLLDGSELAVGGVFPEDTGQGDQWRGQGCP